MPVGLVTPGVEIVQLATKVPVSVYLKTLSVVLSLTTHKYVPSVTMSLGLELPALRLKLLAAFWLPVVRLAAAVYLNTLSDLLSTIQTSVPLVVMPSTWAVDCKVPAVHDPRLPPLVL